jgi:large subunit ribosomal protein L4
MAETKTKKNTVKKSDSMETEFYNVQGKSAGTITLPESVFGLPWNADLVHQVVHSMMLNARTPVAHTKTRGEVRGGGRKPWQQKGTGRARHGSTRSPIWVGGGVTHGPRNDQNFSRKINKKMKVKALYTIMSRKLRDGEVMFIESLSFDAPKAKQAKEVLAKLAGIKGFEKLSTKYKNAAFVGLPEKNVAVAKSFNNFGNVVVDELRNINPLTILNNKFVVIANPEASIKILEAKMNSAQ